MVAWPLIDERIRPPPIAPRQKTRPRPLDAEGAARRSGGARRGARAARRCAAPPRSADRAPAQDPGPLRLPAGAHLVALASEMKMAMAEVYEVATFYHHFDVVKEGDAAPPAITVRVCDSISCELAGAHELLATLPSRLGARRARACTRRASAAARPRRSPSSARIRSRTRRPQSVSAAVDAADVTHPRQRRRHSRPHRLRRLSSGRRLRARRRVRRRAARHRRTSSR